MNYAAAEHSGKKSADRVRRSTSEHINMKIDSAIEAGVARLADRSGDDIRQRIAQLDLEWDVERILEVNAATLALTGVVLGATADKKWLVLPGLVLTFLLQHGLSGWCPPLPILRRLGVRTRGEIDREKYALMQALKSKAAQ